MKCHVDGCDREAMYKIQQVCQKHYFRMMRNGSYDYKSPRDSRGRSVNAKYRLHTPNGYYMVYEPDHVLSDNRGYIFEHRFVAYNKYGEVSECSLCGTSISWANCHVDHIDSDRTNNKEENLRVTCRACNVMRGHLSSEKSCFGKRNLITINGVTKTAREWAAMPDVSVRTETIKFRKAKGYSDYDAVYAPRITHHNTSSIKPIIRVWSE